MALNDEFEKQGEWLFRRRGYLPLVLIVAFALALRDYKWPFNSYVEYEFWVKLCLAISLLGLAVRCVTVAYAPAGTSGRNTEKQIATRLNVDGMYSLVRHPLYLGNFLIGLGISLAPFVWWLPAIYCFMFGGYYERIMFAEESFLRHRFGNRFENWARETPAFFPRLRRWRQPELSFSIRNVLRREYTGLMVVVLGHAAVQLTEHLIIDERIVYETFWVLLLFVGTISYFVLQLLKKRTTLLDVPGR